MFLASQSSDMLCAGGRAMKRLGKCGAVHCLAMVVLAIVATSARATVISVSSTWNSSAQVINGQGAVSPYNFSAADSLSISGFDPSLGTLDSVSYSITGATISSYASATFRDFSLGTMLGQQSLSNLEASISLPGFTITEGLGRLKTGPALRRVS